MIGFTGKKESGKTTAAKYLLELGFMRMSFAEPLRKMARELLRALSMTNTEIELAERGKETVLPCIGVSYRHLLQTLGTEWGRNLVNSDIWVICAERVIAEWTNKNIVFDDVRFENEASMIRKRGGVIIHLIRSSHSEDCHVSEAGIAMVKGDAVVGNNSSVNDLYSGINRAIEFRFGRGVLQCEKL